MSRYPDAGAAAGWNDLRASRAIRDARLPYALAAAGVGFVIAKFPLPLSAFVLGGGALLAWAIFEPLVGLALMLLLGPAKALIAAAFPAQAVDPGQIAFALFAAAWLARKIARREITLPQLPFTVPFALYLFAGALSIAVDSPASPLAGVQEILKWLEMYLVAVIVWDTARREKLGWVVAVILASGIIQAAIGLWQFGLRGHGPEAFKILGDHYRAYGAFEQPNPFGGFMGLVWPVAIATAAAQAQARRWWASILAALVAIATLAALYLSFSRGAWLGAAAAAVAMLVMWPRRRRMGIALAGGGLAAAFALNNFGLLPSAVSARFADVGSFLEVYDVRGVHINDSNFAIVERLAHWQAAVNMAEAHPLTGVGFGNYEPAYDQYRLINWQDALGHAHMIYLNVLAETGAVGLAAYLALWGAVALATVRAIGATSGFDRALAVGLMGCWAHLATHQLLDNLYVNNVPLFLGALLGMLGIMTTEVDSHLSLHELQ